MTRVRLAYSTIIFIVGLGAGAFCSPIASPSKTPENRPVMVDGSAVSDAKGEKSPSRVGKEFGEEAEKVFLRQFGDMTITIKKDPIDACASPDGRFTIRLFGSDETIASDLRYPDKEGAVKELVRHYSYSNGDARYFCDFGRSIENSKMTSIVFDVAVKERPKFVYVDSDGDGLWDRFTDFTQKPPKTYVREGTGWSWKEASRQQVSK